MDPVTHALTSLAIARAAKSRLPRHGTSMIVAAGVAPDLDYASYFFGASAFLRVHRATLHSIIGAALLTVLIAAASCAFHRRYTVRQANPSLRFGIALAACGISVAGHVLLDLASGEGIQPAWPFRTRWQSWDVLMQFDPWIVILLLAGLLLPPLFRMVGEEIGERKRNTGIERGAIAVLALVLIYTGARAKLHGTAVELLLSREYHGRVPLAAGAYPAGVSPFEWRGVISTDNTIEEVRFSLAPGANFDPDRSLTRFKPQPSPALDAGQRTAATERFLLYARFPFARVDRREQDYRFVLRDARFPEGDASPANILVVVDMSSEFRVRREEFAFAATRSGR